VLEQALRIQNGDGIPEYEGLEWVVGDVVAACRAAAPNRSWRFLSACLFCFLPLRLAIPPSACKTNGRPHQRTMITTRSSYTKHKPAWQIKLCGMARAAFQHPTPTYFACSSGQTWDEVDAVFSSHCTAPPGLANLKHQAYSDQPMAEL
jgi:hypothetical protein